jgi:hypothetical protein
VVHPSHRLQGGRRTDRKRMHHQRSTLEKYLALVRRIENFFKGFTVECIDRNKNAKADELTKAAARNTPLPVDVFLQIISDTLIKTIKPEPRVINIIQGED